MIVRIIGGHGGVAPGCKATSYLIDGKVLIDAGSVASGLSIQEQAQVESIFISHPHLDHIKDLAFVADNCFGLRPYPFDVYANETVEMAIRDHIMNDLIWPDFSKLPSEENPTIRYRRIEKEKIVEVGGYKILPVPVNHPGNASGFIVEHEGSAILFTQDTGPTKRIWDVAKSYKNIKAIFTEVSFPNDLLQVAVDSLHHTPRTLKEEVKKMPKNIPIFLGHLKPNFQDKLFQEVKELNEPRITIIGNDNSNFVF